MNEFSSSPERNLGETAPDLTFSPEPSDAQVRQAACWLSTYLREQREPYLPSAYSLSQRLKALLWPYFSGELLERSRILELQGARMASPRFFTKVRALGFELPEISQIDSMTFLDVVVFNEQLDERSLFHSLVHAVQIQVLGLERYVELWVSGFVRTRTCFTMPLEVHAVSLASIFVGPTQETFSVADHVLRWVIDERY